MLEAGAFARAVRQRPSYLLLPLIESGLLGFVPDRYYLPFCYRVLTGKTLNLRHPKTFNEKIAWLKINDRDPLYQALADKYRARAFVQKWMGEQWLIPLLGVWDSPDSIDFEALPDRFVLKCSRGYGGVVACRDKDSFDVSAARETLRCTQKTDFYTRAREWAYGEKESCIIAEELIEPSVHGDPIDFKFMCMNGHVTLICASRSVSASHAKTGELSFFFPDGSLAPFRRADYPALRGGWPAPESFREMYDAAERMAQRIDAPFVRIDFYDDGGIPRFSEFTFYPCGGTMVLDPEEYDIALGGLLRLPGEVRQDVRVV